jgi:glycine hydroxymethyltransferase
MSNLSQTDSEIFNLIEKEKTRQTEQLVMIPSENYASSAVLEAVGSVLMNKYSEGQAFKRYYPGNINIDQIETLVKERALKAFKLNAAEWGVNVQAVTGSAANLAVYAGLLNPGDKILSMFLYDGGHLSHGWKLPDGKSVSFTSKIFEPHYYYVDPHEKIFNYDEVAKRAREVKPAMIISGGTAYPREIDHAKLREIADDVGCLYLADIAHEAGLVLAGVNVSPFSHAHVVTMTTRKTLRGPVGAMIFARSEFIERINSAVFPGLQGGPQNHSIAGIGVALQEALQPEFKDYAKLVVKNAQTLAVCLMNQGYEVCSGGTDKHLILIDLRNKGMNGTEASKALEKAGIIINKNTVPGETGKPWNPSGIRLGTPALTSRRMNEKDMENIADWINEVLANLTNEDRLVQIEEDVKNFAIKFPVPGIKN